MLSLDLLLNVCESHDHLKEAENHRALQLEPHLQPYPLKFVFDIILFNSWQEFPVTVLKSQSPYNHLGKYLPISEVLKVLFLQRFLLYGWLQGSG